LRCSSRAAREEKNLAYTAWADGGIWTKRKKGLEGVLCPPKVPEHQREERLGKGDTADWGNSHGGEGGLTSFERRFTVPGITTGGKRYYSGQNRRGENLIGGQVFSIKTEKCRVKGKKKKGMLTREEHDLFSEWQTERKRTVPCGEGKGSTLLTDTGEHLGPRGENEISYRGRGKKWPM